MSCPICGKPTATGYRPFCSRRCADIDLGRWFNESYRTPAAEADDPESGSDAPPPPKPH
jgi:endogenous inhibitor of DNA gyrase (YacG/DUF329 family)